MNKLLSANFARLRKNKVFWIGMAFMFAAGIYIVVMNYVQMTKTEEKVHLDHLFFVFILFIGVLSAAFCSLFTGTEYSDGTIRNKLVIGHDRNLIYLSNFILCAAVGLLMSLSYMMAAGALGIPLFGFFEADIKDVLMYVLASITVILAFTSIFTLLSMTNQNKAVVAIISVAGFFVLMSAATYIISSLNEPEIYDSYMYMDDLGGIVTKKAHANPNYLRGMTRKIYEFFYDFLPTGQALQISKMSAQHFWHLPLYSMLITVVTTAVGLFCFRKKDLK